MKRSTETATPESADEWADKTIVDGEHVTPLELPRCTECGALCFIDSFDPSVVPHPYDRCMRAPDGHWWCCANYGPGLVKIVTIRRV